MDAHGKYVNCLIHRLNPFYRSWHDAMITVVCCKRKNLKAWPVFNGSLAGCYVLALRLAKWRRRLRPVAFGVWEENSCTCAVLQKLDWQDPNNPKSKKHDVCLWLGQLMSISLTMATMTCMRHMFPKQTQFFDSNIMETLHLLAKINKHFKYRHSFEHSIFFPWL